MALSGLHVACGYAGASAENDGGMPLMRKPVWSQTLSSAGATSSAAPSFDAGQNEPVMEIIASVDAYVAFGPTPDASASPRAFVPASTLRQFYVAPGDKLAWVAA